MKRQISKLLLFLLGWKIKGTFPSDVKKCVILAAPHTSNFDFWIGLIAFNIMRLDVHFLIKKEAFTFPFTGILRRSGGIPIDRRNSNNMVNQIIDEFNSNDSFYLAITPEGTRKKTNHWKKGYYFIAQKANVPLALVYIDYKKKEGGMGPVIIPSGDYEKDLKTIQDFYRTVTPKYPEQFNLSPVKEVAAQPEKSIKDLSNRYCCKR
jgi:1-acyl-sn-glycerol-3-phosphate acyltransferase